MPPVTDGVFDFASLQLSSGSQLRFEGSQPARLYVRGEALHNGRIDVSGRDLPEHDDKQVFGQTGGEPGPSGGAGGDGGRLPTWVGFEGMPGTIIPTDPTAPPTLEELNGQQGAGVPDNLLNPTGTDFGAGRRGPRLAPGHGDAADAAPAGQSGRHPGRAMGRRHRVPDQDEGRGGRRRRLRPQRHGRRQQGHPGRRPPAPASAGRYRRPGERLRPRDRQRPRVAPAAPLARGGLPARRRRRIGRRLAPAHDLHRRHDLRRLLRDGLQPAGQDHPYIQRSSAGGGGGGGALQVQAGARLVVDGVLDASGGRAAARRCSNSAVSGGGGAGGALLVQSPVVQIASVPGRVDVSGRARRVRDRRLDRRHRRRRAPADRDHAAPPLLASEASEFLPPASSLAGGAAIDDIFAIAEFEPLTVGPGALSGRSPAGSAPRGTSSSWTSRRTRARSWAGT